MPENLALDSLLLYAHRHIATAADSRSKHSLKDTQRYQCRIMNEHVPTKARRALAPPHPGDQQ